jgi:hypothetical protein
MHGLYMWSMDRQLIPVAERGEIWEGITAAQDRELQTKYHATVILQTETQRANE